MQDLLAQMEAEHPCATSLAWLEKVRRFASYFGRNLRAEAQARFGSEAHSQVEWMLHFLLKGGDRYPDKGAVPIDPACVSAALYCLDAISRPRTDSVRAVKTAEKQLLDACMHGELADPPASQGFLYEAGGIAREDALHERIVLISPNPYSLYSLAVLTLCLRLRLNVVGILVRSFSAARLREEWRRDGFRLPRKIWRKLVLRSDENGVSEGLSLRAVLGRISPEAPDVRRIAALHGIRVLAAGNFDEVERELSHLGPDLGLFTGGGLISQSTIGLFSRGIINAHLGQLPHYKGMDVVEAPLLENRTLVGATTHLMVPKLDAGATLLRVEAGADTYRSLGALRNSLSCMLPFLMIQSAVKLISATIQPVEQTSAGRQFFIVHPRLRRIIDARLKNRGGTVSAQAQPLEAEVAKSIAAAPLR